jgi:hypothetical protein
MAKGTDPYRYLYLEKILRSKGGKPINSGVIAPQRPSSSFEEWSYYYVRGMWPS